MDPDPISDLTAAFSEDKTHAVASDVAYKRLAIVNAIFVGEPTSEDRKWVLIDTGPAGFTGMLEKAARQRYGKQTRPGAIIITHGHFDHVGGLKELAKKWNVTVYAHNLEMPFLDGRAACATPDHAADGMISKLSPFFPTAPVDVGAWLQPLPADGSVPGMQSWKWIHTPGHSPGHVSLWRESDRLLLAGDAFFTTDQESAYGVSTQKPELHGPSTFFTTDRNAAMESIAALARLAPETVVTGHGKAMSGPEMRAALEILAAEFVKNVEPTDSTQTREPARAKGSAYRKL